MKVVAKWHRRAQGKRRQHKLSSDNWKEVRNYVEQNIEQWKKDHESDSDPEFFWFKTCSCGLVGIGLGSSAACDRAERRPCPNCGRIAPMYLTEDKKAVIEMLCDFQARGIETSSILF